MIQDLLMQLNNPGIIILLSIIVMMYIAHTSLEPLSDEEKERLAIE